MGGKGRLQGLDQGGQVSKAVNNMVGTGGFELCARLVAIAHATGVASGRGTHLEVENGVAHHEGVPSLDVQHLHSQQREVGSGFGAHGPLVGAEQVIVAFAEYPGKGDEAFYAQLLHQGVERHVVT